MRLLCLILIGVWFCAGCASPKSASADKASPAKKTARRATTKSGSTVTVATNAPSASVAGLSITNGTQVITLTNPIAGKVASVNTASRFAVLNFSVRQLPSIGLRLNLYRQGVKVGEVKVSGPVLQGNVVADLVAGEAQPGDDARSD